MAENPEEVLCCPPDCCEGLSRGFLNFQILWELGKEELNGQQIAERIAKRRGTKPTPGTIYPALKELKKGNYIDGVKEGREIVYNLTRKGEDALLDASKYFHQAFGDIAEDVKVKIIVIDRRDKKRQKRMK